MDAMSPSVAGLAAGPWYRRAIVMARVGASMALADRARFVGTVLGVVFSVVLAVQQLGILFGLLQKNTMFVDNAGAEVWIAPPGAELFVAGQPISETALRVARVTEGVAVASPLVATGGSVKRPDGGSEGVTLVGTDTTTWLGGPWNLVAGGREALLSPDTLVFEESEREQYGGMNLGSRREVNGRLVTAGGFTWGLLPFGPPYTFGDIDTVRELAGAPATRVDFVLVTVSPGHTPDEVAARLADALPDLTVITTSSFHDRIVSTLLREQLGVSFGTSTSFGLLIGLVVVALSMFSSVIDNLREFGTLKAVGCTNGDLTVLVLSQSVLFAVVGSLTGLFLATGMASGIRSAKLAVIVPTWLVASVPIVMLVMCLFASVLALGRVRRLEPGMVFR
jgi:putative ABC transport system permease protein